MIYLGYIEVNTCKCNFMINRFTIQLSSYIPLEVGSNCTPNITHCMKLLPLIWYAQNIYDCDIGISSL